MISEVGEDPTKWALSVQHFAVCINNDDAGLVSSLSFNPSRFLVGEITVHFNASICAKTSLFSSNSEARALGGGGVVI